mgnify:CR=1 FL=1
MTSVQLLWSEPLDTRNAWRAWGTYLCARQAPLGPRPRAQVAGYAKEDLDLFGFALSDSEMTLLDNYKKPKA